MKKLDDILFSLLCHACGILMFCMMSVIFAQVVARYAFHHSLSWSEEIGRYIFVWISFLGMVAAFKYGSHVSLDILLQHLKGCPRRVLVAINGLLILIMSSAIFWSGVKLFQLGTRQVSPALKLPMHLVYMVVPISGFLLAYFAVRALWINFHTGNEKEE